MQLILTPELLVHAYSNGVFPMAPSAASEDIEWFCPTHRGQLSIPDLHIPKRLLKTLRRAPYEVHIDRDFTGVISACAQPAMGRTETWINDDIIRAYSALHEQGYAHSVECWRDGVLVGGLYGVKIGAAFFGESMFTRATDASKIALVHLAARLWRGGFEILDTQFVNDHLEQFGVYEMPHEAYMASLAPSLKQPANFTQEDSSAQEILKAYLDSRLTSP